MNAPTSSAPFVPCPICSNPAAFTPKNPSRPFCSERCKLIDLGEWAKEGYRIPLAEHEPEKGEDLN